MTPSLQDGWRAARSDPAFALYILALASLGFKWLSPLGSFYYHATWSDAFIAAAAAVWLVQRSVRRDFPRIRAFHVGLGLYVAAGALSLAFASDQTLGAKTVLLMLELCVLALLTSEFASQPHRINAIAWVIVFVTLYTAILAAVGLGLFYAGHHTSLLSPYGVLEPSSSYARIAAGFELTGLLGSFCIFGSAVVAREDVELPRRLRLTTQILLGVLVVLTFSRSVIAFACAIALRAAYGGQAARWLRMAAAAFVVACLGLIAALGVGRLHIDPTHPTGARYVALAGERKQKAQVSFETFTDHPLVGTGPGSLPGRFGGGPARAHITPLNIAATMGIPALAAFTFLVVVLWRNRRRPIPIATWSGLAGLAIDGLAQDIDHFRHVWVLLGLADADRREGS